MPVLIHVDFQVTYAFCQMPLPPDAILDQEHKKPFADNSLINDETRFSRAPKQDEKPLYTAESGRNLLGP